MTEAAQSALRDMFVIIISLMIFAGVAYIISSITDMIKEWRERRHVRSIILVRDELEDGPVEFPKEFAKTMAKLNERH